MIPGAAELLEPNENVDEVLYFDFPNEGALNSLRFVLNLRRSGFDATILSYPSNRLEYNLIALLIGAKHRVGHRYRHLNRLCGNGLNTISVLEDDALSNVEENLRLVEALTGHRSDDTGISLTPDADAAPFAKKWFADRGLVNRTIIGFHAGGSTRKNHLNKRWAPNRFSELGRLLIRDANTAIIVFGGPEESEVKQHIVDQLSPNAYIEDGEQLMETCAIVERCDYFISNDSALLHLATALGVPTTGVFGPTNADWVNVPGFLRHDVSLELECQPCFYYSPRHLQCRYGDFRCLDRLSAEQVGAVILQQLDHLRRDAATPVGK